MLPLLPSSPFTSENESFLNVLLLGEETSSAEHSTISKQAHGNPTPLSFAQERMWLLEQLEPGNCGNIQCNLRMRGKLCLEALQRSLNQIVQRHEILRAAFRASKGVPRQFVRPALPVPLPIVDLSGWPQEQRESVAGSVATKECTHIFDLQHGSLLRATLLHLHQEDHVFVLTVHPIIADEESLSLFAGELLTFYSGAFAPELPIQYSDFAVWQRKRFEGEQSDRDLRYWRNRMAEAPMFQELPTDRQRPTSRSHRGARQPIALDRELVEQLRGLGQHEDCTLFMVLLATLQTVLHRYTGSEDIVVGSSVPNRTRPETEGVIGHFSNALPLRTELSGDPTFFELLRRVRKTVCGAYAHQEFPFEKLQATRNPDCAPPFQIFFTLNTLPQPPLPLPELNIAPFQTEHVNSRFDVAFHLFESDGEIQGWVDYSTDLFEARTIERLIGHYLSLLKASTTDPQQRISHLTMLPPTERAWQLNAFDHTCSSVSTVPLIHESIHYQAARTPSAIAAEYEGQSLTYQALELRTDRLAHVLNALDLQPDDIVAVCIDRSMEMLVALLGILKAGAAYLPLDPSFPEERLASILRDAQPRAILTTREAARHLLFCQLNEDEDNECVVPLIYLDAEAWEGIPYPRDPKPPRRIAPEQLAYVIYTSGSTGQPKGVQISHGAFANFAQSMQRRPGISAEDTLLAITTVSFDIAALELLVPLAVGARVVIASTTSACRGEELTRLFTEIQPTIMQATPATWSMLIESGWQGHNGLKILCGGEAWSQTLAAQLLTQCGSLWNMYGPTETTVWSAVDRVECGQPVLIGEPVANTSLYILDRHQQLLPIGAPGELYIGGDGLARGYLRRPELTARKFIPNPFNPETGERLYRTGDLARYRPNGKIEFLGRVDSQTKIGGFRVELGEIETALASHPAIAHAMVTTCAFAPADQRLVAYIVVTPGFAPDKSGLQHFLRRTLPSYMVPSQFVVVEAMPMTSNGKIDRKALPDFARYKPARQEAPRSELERTILKIWEDILGTDKIGLDDDFFTLGGHSLQIVWMHQRLKEVLGRAFPIVSLFKNTTINRISEYLQGIGQDRAFSAEISEVDAYQQTENACRWHNNQEAAI